MLKEIDEFGNYAYILKLKEKYFKEILERSAAKLWRGRTYASLWTQIPYHTA